MAGDLKTKYGTSNQSITITLASLGDGSARESTAIDNSGNLFVDALVAVKIKTGAASVSSTGYLNIYAYGTADGASSYNGNATGTDAAVTLTAPPNLAMIGVLNAVANATTYRGLFSVAEAFGGVLPDHWGIVIENKTGAALDATGGNHGVAYQGIYGQYT